VLAALARQRVDEKTCAPTAMLQPDCHGIGFALATAVNRAACSRTRMRRHHEELLAAPSIVPALSLLIPFAAALWTRIKSISKDDRTGE
jgi:hypothetical protein